MGKKRLSSVLTKAKELYQRKKARTHTSESRADSSVIDVPNVGLPVSSDLGLNREGVLLDPAVSQVAWPFTLTIEHTYH